MGGDIHFEKDLVSDPLFRSNVAKSLKGYMYVVSVPRGIGHSFGLLSDSKRVSPVQGNVIYALQLTHGFCRFFGIVFFFHSIYDLKNGIPYVELWELYGLRIGMTLGLPDQQETGQAMVLQVIPFTGGP